MICVSERVSAAVTHSVPQPYALAATRPCVTAQSIWVWVCAPQLRTLSWAIIQRIIQAAALTHAARFNSSVDGSFPWGTARGWRGARGNSLY
jgi:hypothetical protein